MSLNLLVIGLDGATFDLLRPWAEAGLLPTFARILREGAWGPLRSTTPPISPVAWSSFATGTNPGRHGIYNFVARRPDSYDWAPVTARERRGQPFWTWAGQQGRRVGVFNMPMTYPPLPIPNGYLVSGMGVPDVDVAFATPAELQADLLRRFAPIQLVEEGATRFGGERYGRYLLGTIDDNLAVMRYLLGRYPDTDLLCGVFIASDRAQHFYWQQMVDPSAPAGQRDLIRQVYQGLDRAVGALLAEYPDHTLLIMSDHGAGPYRRLIDLNQWLAGRGWLHWQAAGAPAGPLWRRYYRRLGNALPAGLRRRAKQVLPARLMQQVRSQVGQRALPVDWSRTLAYSLGVNGAVYLNRQGREPEGHVPAEGAAPERLLAEIEAALLALRDPESGEPVVDRVHRGRDLYDGALAHLAPELVVDWQPGYYALSGTDPAAPIWRENLRWGGKGIVHSAEHRPEGVLLALGPGIAAGARVAGAGLLDLAPTILHLLGLPIPGYMAGRVLEDLLDRRLVNWPPVRQEVDDEWGPGQVRAYSDDEEAEMLDRLRDLGYVG